LRKQLTTDKGLRTLPKKELYYNLSALVSLWLNYYD